MPTAQELQEKGADEATMSNAFANWLAETLRPLRLARWDIFQPWFLRDEELESGGGGLTWLLEDVRWRWR